jgi:hypothetical protein
MNKLPINTSQRPSGLQIEGQTVPEGFQVNVEIVEGDYFRTMGIPFLSGRTFFSDCDTEKSPGVAIITDSLARLFFVERHPIGGRLALLKLVNDEPRWRVVIGVVGDVRDRQPTVYIPNTQLLDILF